MTDPTSTGRRSARDTFDTFDTFDTLIQPDPATPDAPDSAARAIKHPWLLPAATVLLAALGAGALVAAALNPTGASAGAEPSNSPAPTSTPLAPTPQPVPPTTTLATGAADTNTSTAVSELADRAWVARTAKSANIPERALTAYAGAAIMTARTNPSCGLGWNTLAAIGLVESGNGTMHNARIGDNGVASPTIIGVPLNGGGLAKVPDTDQGRLDGDTTWDRAVGPMQFLPATWTRYAQDGNGDGTADINQIDDAALTAAAYLCTAGGDLTQPANWIIAISAYNPSIEYNNRVAEAASHYANIR
ncbi:lytic murein transglycosylase [Arthrobacter sp. NPDC080073]|uniref:lytic transglycosylase domain-containing protein n=1 Tax=Arthrobacter sp. NPDC080073 TaxID=3155919 RepID=UPI0034359471